MANAWPTPRPSSDQLDTEAAARNESAEARRGPIPNSLDFSHVVDSLRASATGLQHEFDTLLAGVTLAAIELAGATGAALALRTHGAVVCRARAGETAPPVGTQLDMDSGISGACLRTGVAQLCSDTASDPRVDAEASRELGVRSLAAVPLLDHGDVVGILEIFSNRPGAFSQSHIALLQHLAEIAVAGRNPLAEADVRLPAVPVSTEVAAPAVDLAPTIAGPFADEPAAEASSATTVRWTPRRVRVALAVLAVLISVGWLAFRRSSSPTSPALLAKAGAAVPASSSATREDAAPRDGKNGLVPQSFAPTTQKPAAGLNAAPSNVIVQASDRASLRRNALQVAAPTKSTTQSTGASNAQEETTPLEASQLTGPQGGAAALPSSIVSSSVPLPVERLEVSQGVTGGTLVHQVTPVYPKAAAVQRIEGPVTLQAIVNEDGTIHDIKVISGDPVLALAAQQAVEQWRYSPYLLNGKPVSMRTEITVRFKLP